MKAVIVVNLPENTQIEDFRLDDISVYHRPNQRGYKLQGELKPMPEEKEDESCHDYDCFLTRFQGGVGDKKCYMCGEANGYNKCIDEILGEE